MSEKLEWTPAVLEEVVAPRKKHGRPSLNIEMRCSVAVSVATYCALNEIAVFEEASMAAIIREAIDAFVRVKRR